MTIHLTLCGPYAGRPLCACDREKAAAKGDTFIHASCVHVSDETLKSIDMCGVCLAYWETADEENDDVADAKIADAIRRQKAAERLAAGEQTLPFE